ncbi:hypothetical protein [Pantoea sp. App145]|uniref:hypothetical protein n=1 Tax=Pantoea sp. App145 TaxID=3071567 RepID=UPI003A80B21C
MLKHFYLKVQYHFLCMKCNEIDAAQAELGKQVFGYKVDVAELAPVRTWAVNAAGHMGCLHRHPGFQRFDRRF